MITVIFTCFNRKEKTIRCIKSLVEGNPSLQFSFVVLDDASTDATAEAIERLYQIGDSATVLRGDGNSYWAGGMRKAIAYAKEHTKSEYYLLVNDDVEFVPHAVETLLREYEPHTALVGAMKDQNGAFSYGGVRYTRGIHYVEVKPTDSNRACDAFNMNCLLIDQAVFMEMPNFDIHYMHSLADFDYGLEMKRRGIRILVASEYAGVCHKNDASGGWTDRTLSRRARLRQKESVKGAPFRPWFYFLKKNFGMGQAILHGFTPYVRILLGK